MSDDVPTVIIEMRVHPLGDTPERAVGPVPRRQEALRYADEHPLPRGRYWQFCPLEPIK